MLMVSTLERGMESNLSSGSLECRRRRRRRLRRLLRVGQVPGGGVEAALKAGRTTRGMAGSMRGRENASLRAG